MQSVRWAKPRGGRGWWFPAWLAACLLPLWLALGQREPRLGYVFPAGGAAGSTFTVLLGGQFLDGATNLHLAGGGAQAVVLDHTKPITPRELNLLRDELEKLQARRQAASTPSSGVAGTTTNAPAAGWSEADERRVAEIRRRLANRPNRQISPALAEVVTVRLTLDLGARSGLRELRLETAAGLSNPIRFCVGRTPEFVETETLGSRAAGEETVSLPVVVNGQIRSGDVDRFRFRARAGQRLVLSANARRLMPYLADAVPGWFQATLQLFDPGGREVGYGYDYQLQPDPVIFYEAPADGEYTVAIRDSLHRGREDFVYRLNLGEWPVVTNAFPLGGRVGSPIAMELAGWNFGATNATVTFDAPGVHSWQPMSGPPGLNERPCAVDTLAECVEHEPDDEPAGAQRLVTPVIVNGRIDRPGDIDWFRIEARAGEMVIAEVLGRRLNSPLDSVLTLTDTRGRSLAVNDDHEDPADGLNPHHADSYLRFAVPEAGTYFIRLADTQGKGGPAFGYRLRVGPPRPDFALRVVPSTLNVPAGATVPVTVQVLRQDGFTGDIELALVEAPEGCRLAGARLPAGQDAVRLTLSVSPGQELGPHRLRLEGRARIGDAEIVRPAVPAEDRMQAFNYRHLVPADEWLLMVLRPARPTPRIRWLGEMPVRIPAGGTAPLRYDVPMPRGLDPTRLALDGPPDGLTLETTRSNAGQPMAVLRADATRLKPGQAGNLVLTLAPPAVATSTNRPARRGPPLWLPALPFEIVERP